MIQKVFIKDRLIEISFVKYSVDVEKISVINKGNQTTPLTAHLTIGINHAFLEIEWDT